MNGFRPLLVLAAIALSVPVAAQQVQLPPPPLRAPPLANRPPPPRGAQPRPEDRSALSGLIDWMARAPAEQLIEIDSPVTGFANEALWDIARPAPREIHAAGLGTGSTAGPNSR